MTALTLAICNQKGGVGKTTTTFQLGRAGVVAGKRVLLVDLDPQGNLTSSAYADAGNPENSGIAGVADVLQTPFGPRAEVPTLEEVIVPTVWENVDLVGTFHAGALSSVLEQLVVAGPGREQRLRKAIATVAENYDLVLIDCPPSLDQLTVNALVAADGVIIVTEPGMYSASGLNNLIDTLARVRDAYNPSIRVSGVVINGFNRQTIGAANWKQEVISQAEQLNLPVLRPVMPHRVVIKDATEAGLGVDQWPATATAVKEIPPIYQSYLTQIEGAFA